MFGDKTLIGQFDVSTDDKGRMFIPSKFNSEVGDNLVLMYDDAIDAYKLYNIKTFEDKIKYLLNLVEESKTESEKRERSILLQKFWKQVLLECSADKQRRISLSQVFEKHEELFLCGAGDHVIIERKNHKK